LMHARSVLLNDTYPPYGRCLQGPEISDRIVIDSAATIAPKVKIWQDEHIATMSMVTNDVPLGWSSWACQSRSWQRPRTSSARRNC
jgi:serine acetyltransferase